MTVSLTTTATEEAKIIKGLQQVINMKAGAFDAEHLVLLYHKLGLLTGPVTLMIHNHPVIISKKILAFSPGGTAATKNFTNCISGGFTYPRCVTPGAILRNNNADVCSASSHGWAGYPETCLYQNNDGIIAAKRVKTTAELPNLSNIRVAVSGAGLMNMYNPTAEGFCKFTDPAGVSRNYSDVLLKNSHIVLGAKSNLFFGVYFESADAAEMNDECINLFQFDLAVLLDGGKDISSMNGSESFSKINTSKKQGYMIQFV